jgi:hypothetical protein
MKRILRLHLKGCYFEAIRDGLKTEEFRLSEKWERRLSGKTFDEVHLFLGYPKRGDESRVLRRVWLGYRKIEILHPHFGSKPVIVCAINVALPVSSNADLSNPASKEK